MGPWSETCISEKVSQVSPTPTEPLPVSLTGMAMEKFACDARGILGTTTLPESSAPRERSTGESPKERMLLPMASNGTGGGCVVGNGRTIGGCGAEAQHAVTVDETASTTLYDMHETHSIDEESLMGMLCDPTDASGLVTSLLSDSAASTLLEDALSQEFFSESFDGHADGLHAVDVAYSAPMCCSYDLALGPVASPPFSPPQPTSPMNATVKTSAAMAASPLPSGSVAVNVLDAIDLRRSCCVPLYMDLFACVLLLLGVSAAATVWVSKLSHSVSRNLVGHAQRAVYSQETQLLIDTLSILGVGLQLSMSFTLAPRGGKSRPINTVWVLGMVFVMAAVHCLDALELRGPLLGSCGSFILCLTRLQRALVTARGTPSDAGAWLSLGEGVYGTFRKSVLSTLVASTLLAMMSVGAPAAIQAAYLMIPEVCRKAILLQAALCAREPKGEGGRVFLMSAMAQALIGCVSHVCGVAVCVWHASTYA